MSKSHPDPRTRILLTDPPALIRDKLRTAVTDSEPHISYDPSSRPGVSNLLAILSGLTDRQPEELVSDFEGKSMRDLKTAVGDALEPFLTDFQGKFERIRQEQGYLEEMEKLGRKKAQAKAAETMGRVRQAVGLDYRL